MSRTNRLKVMGGIANDRTRMYYVAQHGIMQMLPHDARYRFYYYTDSGQMGRQPVLPNVRIIVQQ